MRVRDIYTGSNSSSPSDLADVYGMLYFVADDGVGGRELWKSNGTEGSTVRVKDICTGTIGSAPGYLTLVGDFLFLSADDGERGRELWVLDLDIRRVYLPLVLKNG